MGPKTIIYHLFKKGVFFLLLSLLPALSDAQNGAWEIGATGGISTYFGDIAPKTGLSLSHSKGAYGFFIQKELTPFFSLKSSFLTTRLSGDDYLFPEQPERLSRGFFFNTSVTEIAFTPEWEPFRKTDLQRISPAFFFGPALFFIEPQANFDRNKTDGNKEGIISDLAKDYPGVFFGLSGGIGVNVHLGAGVYLEAGAGLRVPFTDYLDGISQAGNPEQNDWYGVGTLSVSYRFRKADDDGDGIPNTRDKCPKVPGKEQFYGCPDTDEDGMEDLIDDCPFEPGVPDLFGCPDADADGIADKIDRCPFEAGPALHFGCPYKDSDGDGIDDLEDDCPYIAGTASSKGCPEIDTDGDGILDEDDKCPKAYGIDIFKGCPDTDGDGIEDARDHCPETFGLYENNGCPVIVISEEQASELNQQHIHFDTGKYDPDSYEILDQVAVFLQENPSYSVRLNGYSDSGGSKDQNKYVSRKRAKNCYYYLERQGISLSRMSYNGYGEQKPVANNQTPEGRQQNRRVEIELYQTSNNK